MFIVKVVTISQAPPERNVEDVAPTELGMLPTIWL